MCYKVQLTVYRSAYYIYGWAIVDISITRTVY